MNSPSPIRSRAAEEGSFEIPLWGIPFVLLLLYVCLFSGLGSLGLVGPDEPRYAAIARAMAETHDWITPRLWGTPWFEKPVLYYWAAGIAMRLFGVSEFSARLPSALAALLAVVAIKWTALRSYGLGTAWYSLLMLPTSVAMIGFARAASPDMLFAGLLTATMAIASEMLQKPRPGPILHIAFGFFLGAAVLAKGPAAVILAGGAMLLWAALTRQWLAPFRFLHPLIVAVFCATALPWYVLCALRNPDFLRVFFWQHNFQRYLTPIFEHRQPFWFFAPVLLVGILPWLPLLVSGFRDAARNFQSSAVKDSPALFIGCWALFTLLFFSFSQSKLPGYILPAIPPSVLLLARSLAKQIEKRAGGVSFALAGAGIVFPLLVGIARSRLLPLFALIQVRRGGIQFALVTALIGGGLTVGFALYRNWNCAVYAVAITTLILVQVVINRTMPGIDNLISVRPVAAGLIKRYKVRADEIAVYHLPRAYEFGLDYYFGSAVPAWTPENQGASIIFFSDDSDMRSFLPLRPDAAFSFRPISPDGKIWLAWKKDRPGDPGQSIF